MEPRSLRLAVGGALALVLLPLAVLAFRAPIWLGLLAGLGVMAVAITAPSRSRPGRTATIVPPLPANAMAAALGEAAPALDRLERIAPAIDREAVRAQLRRISVTGRAVLEELSREPGKLAVVQRLLTYYLPRAAEIAESYERLEAEGLLRPERLQAVELVLARLAQAAAGFAQRLVDEEVRELETEVALLEAALQEDLGASPLEGETR